MFIQSVLVSLLGGFICLDRIVLQSMIARPVIAAPLVGLFLGDAYSGLLIGALIELFWIDRLPIGTFVPPNDSLTAILIAASSILSTQAIGHNLREIMTFSILIYIPIGFVGQKMDIFYNRLNDRLSKGALRCAEKSDINGIALRHLLSPVLYFFFSFFLIFFFLYPGISLTLFLFPHFSPSILKALNLIFLFFPLLGISVAMNTIHLRGMVPVFCGIFLLITTILEVVHAL
jgi:PTS system mannose-specific IIC component